MPDQYLVIQEVSVSFSAQGELVGWSRSPGRGSQEKSRIKFWAFQKPTSNSISRGEKNLANFSVLPPVDDPVNCDHQLPSPIANGLSEAVISDKKQSWLEE